MATRAERFRAVEERTGAKKAKKAEKGLRPGKPDRSDMPRILQSSRTRGQDIRVSHPPRRAPR